jgi:hypothetical protein
VYWGGAHEPIPRATHVCETAVDAQRDRAGMTEFQWWVLIAGLAVGGTVVALMTMSIPRGDDDLAADERAAEATFIAAHLSAEGGGVDPTTVERVLEAHREYLGLPVPDAIVPAEAVPPEAASPAAASAGDGDPDRDADEVGHGGGGGADEDLPRA